MITIVIVNDIKDSNYDDSDNNDHNKNNDMIMMITNTTKAFTRLCI